ncbi:MAG: hypothetical protein WC690_07240 [bacterium]
MIVKIAVILELKMSALLLFGAGASFGSESGNPPPLGPDLFHALQRFDPIGWGSISKGLAVEFQQDFEEAMTKIDPTKLPPLQRKMAQYFFQFQPNSSSLYRDLAQCIKGKNWDGAICSLNYERLLEIALTQSGLKPVCNSPTDPGRTIELCLPHGCCHLFCESVKGNAKAVTFDPYRVKTSGTIKPISNQIEYDSRIEKDAFPPVMSYFEPNKRTSSGANFIQTQRNRWHELASAADCIGIVGVKLRPHDGHIWDPLIVTKAKIIYCSGRNAAADYQAWATKYGRKQDSTLTGYFREEFGNICKGIGLA